MKGQLKFIYDGECPFCNHFAELIELKSQIEGIKIIDGRKNPDLINELLEKGFDLDKGAILINDEKILHAAEAVNFICKQISNPSDNLLKILSKIFKSSQRSKLIFPFLLRARRFALIAKGVPTSLL